MHPLCRPESVRDDLRGRKQGPSSAMHPLRGRHRPGHHPQSSTPALSKTKPRPNANLQKPSVEEESSRNGLALTE